MTSVDEFYQAFSNAPRPSAEDLTTGSPEDLERQSIVSLLAPYASREVPDALFERYEITSMLPVLTAGAYRYYLPRCIEHALTHSDSPMLEGLLFVLSLGRQYDDRVLCFSAQEREAVRRFIDLVAQRTDAWLHREQIEAAREEWNAAV